MMCDFRQTEASHWQCRACGFAYHGPKRAVRVCRGVPREPAPPAAPEKKEHPEPLVRLA
jgi:rubredoxin